MSRTILLLLIWLLPSSAHTEPSQLRIEHRASNEKINTTLSNAWQAYERGDLSTAWRLYLQATRQDGHNRDALLGLAAIALLQHEDSQSARYFSLVLGLDPQDPVALAGMSQLQGREDAASHLKFLLTQQPGNPALQSAIGQHHAAHARWDEAAAAYMAALRVSPNTPSLHLNLAICLDHLGRYQSARISYHSALQFNLTQPQFDPLATEQRLTELESTRTP